MQYAELMQAGGQLLGLHRGPVVGHQGSGQAALLQRLAQAMHQHLGGFLQIPLQMTDQPRVIVDKAQQQRRDPGACSRQYLTRTMMEIGVPQTLNIFRFITAHLQSLQSCFGLAATRGIPFGNAFAVIASCLHVTAHGAVGRHRLQRRFLLCRREQIVVVQLHAPARMGPILHRQGLYQSRRELAESPGIVACVTAQGCHRVFGMTCGIVPTLQGRNTKTNRGAVDRVAPAFLRQCLQFTP